MDCGTVSVSGRSSIEAAASGDPGLLIEDQEILFTGSSTSSRGKREKH